MRQNQPFFGRIGCQSLNRRDLGGKRKVATVLAEDDVDTIHPMSINSKQDLGKVPELIKLEEESHNSASMMLVPTDPRAIWMTRVEGRSIGHVAV